LAFCDTFKVGYSDSIPGLFVLNPKHKIPQEISMTIVSCMSANYVARQVNYQMTGGWGQGDTATNQYFKPLKTFPQRFEALLQEIQGLGFDAIDLWLPHLNPSWATPEHISAAQELLDSYGLSVVSLAGGFGRTPEELEASCELANAMGTTIMGGGSQLLYTDRELTIGLLQKYGLQLAIENHPEKTPEEILAKIGKDDTGTLGTAVDTGWYGTHGYDAAQAIRRLGPVVQHVHLKDVRAAGGHETCRLGAGVVPVRDCLRALAEIGYNGAISIEHEPEHFNPDEDLKASLALVKGWLAEL
jgi:sugar phosphate isomerase/epimerase